MINILDVNTINKSVIIGTITTDMYKFIIAKRPDYINIINKRDIILWRDRINYIQKHKDDFINQDDLDLYIKEIPQIIAEPDYIGIPPKEPKSIQFIKRYDTNILIAVRISNNGDLFFRSMYPITESQLSDYEYKNKAWKY
jgi:hypothetical protein